MKIISATELVAPKTRCVLYAQAGTGKTTVAKILAENKNILVIDVDRSTVVLKGTQNIDIAFLDENLNNLVEIVDYIVNNANKYDIIFFDNISQLEKNMLTTMGAKGRNDGVPAQADYQRMQFKIYDYIKKILLADTNIILTAWEVVGNTVNAETGESGLRLEPQINNKIINYILGLCNVVAHYEKKKDKEGNEKRFLRLSSTPNVYAKDQINGRIWCELGELIDVKGLSD